MTRVLLILLLAFANYNFVKIDVSKNALKDIFCQIDFQDYFRGDFLEFKVNNCEIFADRPTSNRIDGFADRRVNIDSNTNELTISLENNSKLIKCNTGIGILKLSVIVNKNLNQFEVDLQKGKFIGFYNDESNKVEIRQSTRRFQYD